MYTLFYTAPELDLDGRPSGTWSVRSCEYESINATLPIRGSDKRVSGNHTEAEAERISDRRQRESYALRRQENSNG